jgi:hypothetical protein
MVGFVYNPQKASQLCYRDVNESYAFIMLDFWIHDESDYQRAVKAVRARRFGSIEWNLFFAKVYTQSNQQASTVQGNQEPAFTFVALFSEEFPEFAPMYVSNPVAWAEGHTGLNYGV